MRAFCVLVLLIASALGTADAASASPPANGPIVFQSTRAGGYPELYVQNEAATDVRRLTYNDAIDRMPRFSRDGERIAFASDRDGNFEIYVMRKDGSDVHRITNNPELDDLPVFTADGSRLVWQRGPAFCPCSIWTAAVDGSDERPVHTGIANSAFPDMSPNGSTLTFTEFGGTNAIYTVQLNGRALQQVTFPPAGSGDFRSRWSPSGNDLVFQRDDGVNQNDVYTVHRDGSELVQLTSGPRFEEHSQFAPDGERVIFAVFADDGGARLHTIRRDGTGDAPVERLAAPFADGFDDSVVDTSLWHVITDPGGTAAESGGRLVLSIAAGSVPGGLWNQVDTHIGSQCELAGDYDVSVDYELVDWQAVGFWTALHSFWEAAGVMRAAAPWGQEYVGWVGPFGNGMPTTDTSGSLRLVRTAGVLRSFVRSPGTAEWTQVFGSLTPGVDTVYGLGLTARGDQYTGGAATVAYDGFRVSSGTFRCPSWWRDAGPDWAGADAH